MRRIVLAATLVLLASPVCAQTPHSACAHDPGHSASIGGVNLDDMRCLLSTYQQMAATDAQVKVALTAENRMLQADLNASQEALKTTQADVDAARKKATADAQVKVALTARNHALLVDLNQARSDLKAVNADKKAPPQPAKHP